MSDIHKSNHQIHIFLWIIQHVACRPLDKHERSASKSKCPALRERERGGSQVSLETVVKRKNPYLCHAKNHGYQVHNQSLNLVTHMHKCTLLNMTVFWILIFQKHSNLMACITRQKVRNEFPSPSYETQEHVDLAVVCTCLCCHIWKAAAYELVDEQTESDASSCIHISSNTKPTTTWSSIMLTTGKNSSWKSLPAWST